MQIVNIKIENFRGIARANIFLDGHTVVIGDNNAGKSSVFEAIDLVLGPDRLNKTPVVDEHDFFNGIYLSEKSDSPVISIELVIINLEEEQKTRFKNHLEFWDKVLEVVLPEDSIDAVDSDDVVPAIRLKFCGSYNGEDDDFEGDTFFCWPEKEDGTLQRFSRGDKRECGFLYLRALRTGSRALSMERGSLLDIILRIKEIRPKMWEGVLTELKATEVAADPELGVKNVLTGIQDTLKEFVPADWGTEPILRVSDLTREHLRKTLTIFMSTGSGTYHAPFNHQGTGTINTMVLALLSMIAEEKKNVIFAMEEPEIAIPPYTQKRIVDSIRKKSTQAIFTSHSPFVLEEFAPRQIILIQRSATGIIKSQSLHFPKSIKTKAYSSEFRLRFSEALLAKRILLTEGITEFTAYSAAARRLNELVPDTFSSLEAMGVAVFNVMSENALVEFGTYFKTLGKTVFAVFDEQEAASLKKITVAVDHAYEAKYKGFENLIIEETSATAIRSFYSNLLKHDEWPRDLSKYEVEEDADIGEIKTAVKKYLIKNKGSGAAAELLGGCNDRNDFPVTIRKALKDIKAVLEID